MMRIFKLLISFSFWCVTGSWSQLKRLFGRKSKGTCTVLYYHAIPPSQREDFAQQMDLLLKCAKPVRADLTDPLNAGSHSTVVTFDDGYNSVAENALPELEKRGIPATMFIVTRLLGQSPGWLGEKYAASKSEIAMTAEQLRALPGKLITLGSHTMTHPRLTELGVADSTKEIVESRRELEKLVGQPVTLFSFPFGLFNQELVRICHEAGYQRAFTTIPSAAFSEPGEFLTGRVGVDPTDWPIEFRLKVLGAYWWTQWLSVIKHKVLSPWRERGAMSRDIKESTAN